MFTGIVERTQKIVSVTRTSMSRRLVIAADWPDVKLGQSIAINGACLTVAGIEANALAFDVIQETLVKTNLGSLNRGDEVNVERAMRAGDRIDGHFVQGHVDGTGDLLELRRTNSEVRMLIRAPQSIAAFLVPKGSICVDGVSLTIAAVNGADFEVALIPTTLQLTTLGSRPTGWKVNLEADIISKTVVRHLEWRESPSR